MAGIGHKASRRRVLQGSAAAAAGFTFATSKTFAGGRYLGGPQYFRAQSGSIPTPREDTVVINQSETNVYDSFNPFVPNGESITYGLHQIAREPFYIQNFMTGELVPWLASGHEYNDDYTELTMHLKEGITWNDGKPFTSDDVIFTFDMLKENEELYGSSDIQDLVSYEAPDPQSFKVVFSEPDPRYHLNYYSAGTWSQWIRIVPRHIWEGQDPNTFKNPDVVYSGPYKLVEARYDQRYYLWERREDYWNKDVSFAPQYIMFRQSTGADATVQEFQRAGLDVPGMDVLNQQALMGSYDQMVQASYGDPCPRGLTPNHLSPVFSKPEGRWALSYLTDRETIANTIWYPPTSPAIYPWPNWPGNDKWSLPNIQEQYNLNEYNPDKAAELLDSIGITMDGDKRKVDGKDLLVQMISPVAVGSPEYEIGRMVAEAAQGIGLDMQVVNLQSATYGDAVNKGEYDVESNWLCLATTDPEGTYRQPWYPAEGEEVVPIGEVADSNQMRANLPAFRDITDKLKTVSPDDIENPAYAEGLELFYKELPVIPTVQTLYPYVFNTTYWTGWPNDQDQVLSTPKQDLQPFILTLAGLQKAGQ